jgi:RNA polymerase sigma-70 factor (ECF subfamily)
MTLRTCSTRPASVRYARAANGLYEAHTLQVFTVTESGISRTTVFQDVNLLALFDMPLVLR